MARGSSSVQDLVDAITEQVQRGIDETRNIGMFDYIPVPDECPICMETLTVEENELVFVPCCAKVICKDCATKIKSTVTGHMCPFCRKRRVSGRRDTLVALKSLARKGNIDASISLSNAYRNGDGVEVSDYKALKWAVTAASNGSAVAYGILSKAYLNGIIVEKGFLDRRRCLEIAAKMGSIKARRTLINIAADEGDHPTAMLHSEIAASAGCKVGLKNLLSDYKRGGGITKQRLDTILEHYKDYN